MTCSPSKSEFRKLMSKSLFGFVPNIRLLLAAAAQTGKQVVVLIDEYDAPMHEILEALDGTYHIADEDTAEESDCKGIAAAIQTRVIDEVNRQLDQILMNLTLADLVKEYQEFEKYDESMYYI